MTGPLTIDQFLEKWRTGFIYEDPYHDVDREIADREEMKRDLEEMMLEAKRSGAIFAGPSPNIYL